MTYLKMVGDFVRARIGGNEAGQNMVETALIIGTISLVIVAAFLTTGIQLSMANLAGEVACTVQGGSWADSTTTGVAGVCS